MYAHIRKHYVIYLIFLVGILSRLPMLMSDNFLLDGDECIMGLMAKHFIEGKSIPFFFYGQSYGFAFIEVVFISIGYLVFGISDYVVRLSIIMLWLIGVVYFYKSLKLLGGDNKWLPLIIAILLLTVPAWAEWAMKARGGYATAFTLSNIIVYLSLSNTNRTKLNWFIIGLCLLFLYHAQPLWLPGTLALVMYAYSRNSNKRKILFSIIGIAVGACSFFFMKINLSDFWQPTVFSLNAPTLNKAISYIYIHLSGHYYLNMKANIPTMTQVFSYSFFVLLGMSLLASLVSLFIVKGDKRRLILFTLLATMPTLLSIAVIDINSPRYLLPLTGFTLVNFYALLRLVKKQVVINVFFLLLSGIGMLSLVEFKELKIVGESKSELCDVITQLERRNVAHVFCTGGLIQWQLSFYSKERVIARYYPETDRYMAYIRAVDSAFYNSPEHTAIVGAWWQSASVPEENRVMVNKSFFISTAPDEQLLNKVGFEL